MRQGKRLRSIRRLAALFLVYAGQSAYASSFDGDVGEELDYFSSDYFEAREKFVTAANAVGARVESYRHPMKGPREQSLFLDVAVVGPKEPDALLVLVSGTHGVEGFAGSAIQTGLLREGGILGQENSIGVVILHAINPYGFAYLRRVNEDNVDLNRNFLDHSAKYPENTAYADLADVIEPGSLSIWQNTAARLRLLWYRIKHGASALQRAISSGQFTHPKGLFYGGRAETWSNRTLKKITGKYLSGAKHVVVIDFHTGLGPFGAAEMILNVRKDSPAYRRAKDMWGDMVKSTGDGESVSPHLQGTLKLALSRMLAKSEVTAAGLEFGTEPPSEVFWALRAENWLHHSNAEYDITHPIKTRLLSAFYPNSDKWKQQVWQQGKAAIIQAIRKLHENHAPTR